MYDVPDTVDLLFNMDQKCGMIIIQHGQITDNNHIYVCAVVDLRCFFKWIFHLTHDVTGLNTLTTIIKCKSHNFVNHYIFWAV